MRKKAIRGPGGLLLELDPNEVVPDNPGDGTPAMVRLPFGRGSATYTLASEMGVVWGRGDGEIELTRAQVDWLNAPAQGAAVEACWQAGAMMDDMRKKREAARKAMMEKLEGSDETT